MEEHRFSMTLRVSVSGDGGEQRHQTQTLTGPLSTRSRGDDIATTHQDDAYSSTTPRRGQKRREGGGRQQNSTDDVVCQSLETPQPRRNSPLAERRTHCVMMCLHTPPRGETPATHGAASPGFRATALAPMNSVLTNGIHTGVSHTMGNKPNVRTRLQHDSTTRAGNTSDC